MPRRQPYQHTVPASASPAPEPEAILTEDGGLQIAITDVDLVSPAEPQPAPEPVPVPDPIPEPTPPPQDTKEDEAFERLKAQLAAAQHAREEAERRSAEAHSRLGQVEQDRTVYEQDLKTERERAENLRKEHFAVQEVAIDNALRNAEREATIAEDAIQRFLEACDYKGAASAQAALARAYTDINRYTEGKNALAAERDRPVERPVEQPKREPATQKVPQTEWERIEAYITLPAHPPRAQEYMRAHYGDLFSNNAARLNKLLAAHYEAKNQNVPDFSDQYFKFVDKYMGYEKPEQQPVPAPTPAPVTASPPPAEPAKPKSAIPPAAPVSRGAPVNSATGTSITLTPAQVQFCRESGIDPKVYARSILAINKGRADANYTGPRWTSDMGTGN